MLEEKVLTNEKFEMIESKTRITEKIYTIRGVQVMLDFDLAELYGYQTKNFNRQVKNNLAKFEGDDFMFQLTNEEVKELSRCNFFTLNKSTGRGSNIKYNPYAFTEQGIYMLMTVLKGDLAIKQSRELVRTFKEMRHYLAKNEYMNVSTDFFKVCSQVIENTKAIQNIKNEMITKTYFEEVMKEFIGPNRINEYLFLNGEKFSADLAYEQIYTSAKQSIYIIDNYIGPKTLIHLKDLPNTINIIIFSDNIKKGLSLSEFNDFKKEYPNVQISFQTTNGKYHDRYIVLDYGTDNEVIFHCGASSKDAGNRITSIIRINDIDHYQKMIHELLSNPSLKLK